MNKLLVIVAMVVGLLGCVGTPANAAPIGPFCFSPLPFTDQFVFFFDSNGGSQFIRYRAESDDRRRHVGHCFRDRDDCGIEFCVHDPTHGNGPHVHGKRKHQHPHRKRPRSLARS